MDPVKMKAPMPQINSQSAHHPDVDEESATEHEFRETLNSEDFKDDAAQDAVGKADSASADSEKSPKGKRRRRAASSGIITA
jgi:hypothetical protein